MRAHDEDIIDDPDAEARLREAIEALIQDENNIETEEVEEEVIDWECNYDDEEIVMWCDNWTRKDLRDLLTVERKFDFTI